mmetsp:Transcript_13379/g.24937  ORF Transcript_13379/g.24937 Transcript_13379/m.24937 type:complete len:345 (-) Transcript_13379:71-1105(-)
MGASQASSSAVAATTVILSPKPCNSTKHAPHAPGKAQTSKASLILPPAGATETKISVDKDGQGKLALRSRRPFRRAGQKELHRRRQQLRRRQQRFACRGKPSGLVKRHAEIRFKPAHRAADSCKSPPVKGILRTPTVPRVTRKAPWWVPRPLQRASGRRLTFGKTICITEFSRSLGDGVPSEGDIAVGLGRPIVTKHVPLPRMQKRWNTGEELPIVPAECRADEIKKWMGPSRFNSVVEDHQRETARIRESRKDSMEEGKDVTMMPQSLGEALDRAFKVSQEAAEATREFTLPRLVFAQSPQKRKIEKCKNIAPKKAALFQDVLPPPRKRLRSQTKSNSRTSCI